MSLRGSSFLLSSNILAGGTAAIGLGHETPGAHIHSDVAAILAAVTISLVGSPCLASGIQTGTDDMFELNRREMSACVEDTCNPEKAHCSC